MRDTELEITRDLLTHLGRIARANELEFELEFPDERTLVLTEKKKEICKVTGGNALLQMRALADQLATLCKSKGYRYVG